MSDSDAVYPSISVVLNRGYCFQKTKNWLKFLFPFGAVSLQEKFFNGKDFNDAKSIKETRKFVRQVFWTTSWKLKLQIFAIGGSARNVARATKCNKLRYGWFTWIYNET